MKNILRGLTLLAFLSTSCGHKEPVIEDWDSYIIEHKEWQESRVERLKSETGWLNLAGLLWLEEGKNTIGSNTTNTILFPPGFPAKGGSFMIGDSTILFHADPDIDILVNGEKVDEINVNHDQQDQTTVFEYGSYRWFVIKRGERFAIRLRDLEHPRLEKLHEIPSYPFKKEWVVKATLMKFDTLRTIEVPTVIPGFSEFYNCPGELVFSIKGKEFSLLPFGTGNRFFLIVGDETNGLDTYGAGRFLSTGPLEDNSVIIDFNRTYNPPCAFSPFATCPLPPRENMLDLEIEAGEKAVHFE